MLAFLILLSACSSLPKQIQPQEKTNADQILVFAQQLELQHRYADALSGYQSARRQYIYLADSEGQLLALSGLARVSAITEDNEKLEYYRAQMQNMIEMIDKSKRYHLLLLELQVLHQQQDYTRMSELARYSEETPELARLQILTYKVQADAYLKKGDEEEFRYLVYLYNRYAKRLKARKFNSPELVTNAAYSLAYHHYTKLEPVTAKRYIRQAKDIDFRYGLFYNYAFDLWLEGNVFKQENSKREAISALYSALLIFQQYDDKAMQEKINQELRTLGKEDIDG